MLTMCLLLIAIQKKPGYRLILAANRDEYYNRPTAPACFWPEVHGLLAGRDLKAGGTWLGITRNGRIAALTNYRDPASHMANAPSRGELVVRYLSGREGPADFIDNLQNTAARYNGFNLVLGNHKDFYWFSNRAKKMRALTPGIYGISNHLINTPWPKVEKSRASFTAMLSKKTMPPPESFFKMLNDRTPAETESLPETGVGEEWERILSPVFITSQNYGTRSSTQIYISNDDHITFVEKTYDRDGKNDEKIVRFEFNIEN
jgi:uncharacterized protein with NRDE domain